MMAVRPVDIARRFGLSTTTIRRYEDLGLVPAVMRAPTGYRIYTDEHIAYFICIREMMNGFSLQIIAGMLGFVMKNRIDEALWLANKTQAELQNDRRVCEQMRQRFIKKRPLGRSKKEYSIGEISSITGVPASTIRYWSNIGLLSAGRSKENNYRVFTQRHIDEILISQTLKLSSFAENEKYSIGLLRREILRFQTEDTEKLASVINGIEKYLYHKNRQQIKSITALYRLCEQVESNKFDIW